MFICKNFTANNCSHQFIYHTNFRAAKLRNSLQKGSILSQKSFASYLQSYLTRKDECADAIPLLRLINNKIQKVFGLHLTSIFTYEDCSYHKIFKSKPLSLRSKPSNISTCSQVIWIQSFRLDISCMFYKVQHAAQQYLLFLCFIQYSPHNFSPLDYLSSC